jgi:hypothetical protein
MSGNALTEYFLTAFWGTTKMRSNESMNDVVNRINNYRTKREKLFLSSQFRVIFYDSKNVIISNNVFNMKDYYWQNRWQIAGNFVSEKEEETFLLFKIDLRWDFIVLLCASIFMSICCFVGSVVGFIKCDFGIGPASVLFFTAIVLLLIAFFNATYVGYVKSNMLSFFMEKFDFEKV